MKESKKKGEKNVAPEESAKKSKEKVKKEEEKVKETKVGGDAIASFYLSLCGPYKGERYQEGEEREGAGEGEGLECRHVASMFTWKLLRARRRRKRRWAQLATRFCMTLRVSKSSRNGAKGLFKRIWPSSAMI